MNTVRAALPTSQKWAGVLISWLLHPLLIGLYITLYIVYLNPDYFLGAGRWVKLQTILIYVLNSIFFPVISLLLCKALSFVQSFYLHTQKDRIVGYSVTMIFFFWTFYVFNNKPDIPPVMARMALGIFLTTAASFIANIYMKVSMHAAGAGGLVGFFICLLYTGTGSSALAIPLAMAFLLAGLTCTARLLVSDHSTFDVGWGFGIGFICQVLAAYFIA